MEQTRLDEELHIYEELDILPEEHIYDTADIIKVCTKKIPATCSPVAISKGRTMKTPPPDSLARKSKVQVNKTPCSESIVMSYYKTKMPAPDLPEKNLKIQMKKLPGPAPRVQVKTLAVQGSNVQMKKNSGLELPVMISGVQRTKMPTSVSPVMSPKVQKTGLAKKSPVTNSLVLTKKFSASEPLLFPKAQAKKTSAKELALSSKERANKMAARDSLLLHSRSQAKKVSSKGSTALNSKEQVMKMPTKDTREIIPKSQAKKLPVKSFAAQTQPPERQVTNCKKENTPKFGFGRARRNSENSLESTTIMSVITTSVEDSNTGQKNEDELAASGEVPHIPPRLYLLDPDFADEIKDLKKSGAEKEEADHDNYCNFQSKASHSTCSNTSSEEDASPHFSSDYGYGSPVHNYSTDNPYQSLIPQTLATACIDAGEYTIVKHTARRIPETRELMGKEKVLTQKGEAGKERALTQTRELGKKKVVRVTSELKDRGKRQDYSAVKFELENIFESIRIQESVSRDHSI